MQSTWKIIQLLFAVCFNWLRSQNPIDTMEPIVRRAPNGSDSEPYTLFTPYYCTEYRTRRQTFTRTWGGQGKSRKKSQYIICNLYTFRVIVSAPNGTAPSVNSVDNTGLLYLCPILQGDCEPLNGDNSGADRHLYVTDNMYIYIL